MSKMNQTKSGQSKLSAELWQVISTYWVRIVVAVVFLIGAKLAAVAVPLILKEIIDRLSRQDQLLQAPLYVLIGYAVIRFLSTLFTELRDLAFSRVTQQTVAAYAQKTFSHLHALGSSFHTNRRIGGLLPDIDRGTNGMAFLLGVGLFTIVPTLIEIGLVLAIMMSRYSWLYAGIIALTFVVYAAFTLYFTAQRAIYQRRVNRLDSTAKSRMADSLINYDAVKYFTNESVESGRFKHIMENWAEAAVTNQKALFILHVGQSALIGVGVAAIMVMAGYAVVRQEMTVGDLVLINAYVLQVCLPLNALGFVYREIKDAWVNVERLFQLLRERPEIEESPSLPMFKPNHGEVIFDRVSFYYEPSRPILIDVSFRIPPGGTVAVVGGSGSGKSTLARLLLRFYEPKGGRISIDGQDISKLSPQSVRRAIGVVPQDTVLFNESIGYNITYGRIDASVEEMHAAAKAAHIHELIETLAEKYDTQVGERGVRLSSGEKQRIALARAVLKNPPILIFDEATSSLDSYSEFAIQQELERLSRDRTTLIIAHRLSTIINADEIIVLDRGRIVERGTHTELLQRRNYYARMWMLQQRAENDEFPSQKLM
jgi:ATP-binding cassette subfamily B protein